MFKNMVLPINQFSDVLFSFEEPAAKYLFSHKKAKFGDRDDRNLNLIMSVVTHILNKKSALILLDVNTKNQQCHLNSLEVIERMQAYDQQSKEEKKQKTETNRFFYLAFFISKAFNHYEPFFETIQKGMKEINLSSKKGFENELKGYLRKNFDRLQEISREMIIGIVQKSLRYNLSTHIEKPLSKELYKLSFENCMIGEGINTYPTFASLVQTNEIVASKKLTIVIKVSIFTFEGYAGTITEQFGDAKNNDDIVFVCDGIATQEKSLTVDIVRKTAQRCRKYFFQSLKSYELHKEDEICRFCHQIVIDLTPYRKRIKEVMQTLPLALEAMGVDCTLQNQKQFKTFFCDEKNYPELTKRFNEGAKNVEKMGVGSNKPVSFSLCHSYPSRLKDALERRSLIHTSPKKLLEGI